MRRLLVLWKLLPQCLQRTRSNLRGLAVEVGAHFTYFKCCLSPPFVKLLLQWGQTESRGLFRGAISKLQETGWAHARSAAADRKTLASRKSMSTTSRYYRANLGQLEGSTRHRLEAWGETQAHAHALSSDEDGNVILHAGREEPKAAKGHMVALRAMLNHNWRIPLKLPTGFLSLISEEEYRAALANLPNAQPVITWVAVHPTTCAAELLLSLPEAV